MATIILLHQHYDADHLEAVKADMAELGAPKIRVIDGGDQYFAIEGTHRLRAAEETGTPVILDVLDADGTIDLDSLDYDCEGWFEDEKTIPVADFIAWFTRPPYPMGEVAVDVEVIR
jgi:hypothetical protein